MLPPKHVLSGRRPPRRTASPHRVAAFGERERDPGMDTSPAASVSMASILNTGSHGPHRRRVAHRARAVADREEHRGARRHAPQSASRSRARWWPQALAGEDDVGRMPNSRSSSAVGRSASSTTGMPRRAPPRRPAARDPEAVVGGAAALVADRQDRRAAPLSIRGSRWVTIIRSPAASTMMPDTGAVAPATRTTPGCRCPRAPSRS